jgi:hypothetical protein
MIVWVRLLFGFLVLISAEGFSGASVATGFWTPWTWLVTYWLYFAHFFFFTTLAVRTGRTSLGALYLWGVLFGLYESWITKVIWHGYGGDGKLVLGQLGPFGFSELSMVFLFHPVMSFLLPLAVACLLCPRLRPLFPDLAWATGGSRGALAVRLYIILSCGCTLGINSGGPVHLCLNIAFICVVLLSLARLARPGLAAADARSLVVFGRSGFAGLCVYLAVLYGVTYFFLHPEGLPSALIQLITLVFYAVVIGGIWLHRVREPLAGAETSVEPKELRRAVTIFVAVIGLALLLSVPRVRAAVFVPVAANFVLWTPLRFFLTAIALWRGWREWVGRVRCRPASKVV